MKCLEDNGYDKAQWISAFDNYNICRKFWNEVRIKRRVAGIEPNIPLPEDRDELYKIGLPGKLILSDRKGLREVPFS